MTMRGGDAVEQRRAARYPPLRFIYLRSPDAKPRGTGRNGQGRQVTAEAVDQPFAHVTSDDRDRVGMGKLRGDGGATCKSLASPRLGTTSRRPAAFEPRRERIGSF